MIKEANTQARIGFIGSGVMGKSMASHLLKAGYPLSIYTRTQSKAKDLLAHGARWADTVKELTEQSDVIISIVGYPQDVKALYLGQDGIIKNGCKGKLLIDMTTSCPALAKTINEHAQTQGMDALDAPVSGGDKGAQAGTLSIMVGGDKPTFQKAEPLFKIMGKNVVHQGPAGSGQHTKMANQIAIASGMLGVCEALAYAKKSGLDLKAVLKSIESGAAGSWSLSNLSPRILDGDFAPGFFIKHFIKDMEIALDSSKNMKLNTPGLSLALELYRKMAKDGHQDSGTQALIKQYCDLQS